jgi:hypothetical protein
MVVVYQKHVENKLVKYLSMVPMVAYVCYWYLNDYNF